MPWLPRRSIVLVNVIAALLASAPATWPLTRAAAASRNVGQPAPPPRLRLVSPEGHTLAVRSASYSPDGRLVATASFDKTAKLWDASTGREVRRFDGHTGELTAAEFSPDGSKLVTVAGHEARVWDIASGKELQRLVSQSSAIKTVAFAPDGHRLATGTLDGRLRLWEAETGRVVRTLEGHTGWTTTLEFSSDGASLLSASEDGSVRVWDADSGSETLRLTQSPPVRSYSQWAVYIPGKERIVSTAPDGHVAIWDATTGRELRRFRAHDDHVTCGAVSPDGALLVTGSDDRTVRVWNLEAGTLRRELTGYAAALSSVRFSPDGRTVVTSSGWDLPVRRWEVATGRQLGSLEGHTSWTQSTSISPDGQRVAAAVAADGSALVWELATGRTLLRLEGHSGWVSSVAFAPDGRHLLTTSFDLTARLWRADTGELVRRFEGHTKRINAGVFSPDSHSILTVSDDATARIWDVASARVLHDLTGHAGEVVDGAFSPDGRLALTVSMDGTARIWSVFSGREVGRYAAHNKAVVAGAFSPDGRSVITASWDGTVHMWNVDRVTELRRFPNHTSLVSSIFFTRDGRHVVAGDDRTVRVTEVATGREVGRFEGHADWVNSATLSPDGRWLVSTSAHATHVWNFERREELFRRFVVKEGAWVVVAPDGRFDGIETGLRTMHYARGLETLALEAFFDRFFTPGLAGLLLAGSPYSGPDIRRGVDVPPAVRIVSPVSGAFPSGRIVVEVEATDRGGGAEDVRLYHNGTLIGNRERGVGLSPAPDCRPRVVCFSIELLPGANTLEATAFARDRTEAERASVTLDVTGAPPAATLHVLAVGINSYKNPRYDLNYGRADATAIAQALRVGGAGIFADIRVETLFDTAATRATIAAGFARLALSARPEDVFVFYYAGHGTAEQIDGSTRFFLVPSDITQVTDPSQLVRLGLSGEQLRELFEAVPARKKLMILDACQSGEAIGSFARRGAAEERAIAQLARSTGLFVMSSTDSQQFAGEVSTLGHGILTYALLSALRDTGAESRRERTVREIITQAERLTPDLSAKYRGKAQYPLVWSNGMDFPLVIR